MIVIVDFGVGNVASVLNMLRRLRVKARISNDPRDIDSADKLILPGVGSFGHGIKKLTQSGLISALEESVLNQRKPILGICLGMQMMTHGSEEDGGVEGLKWVNGRTKKMTRQPGLTIPHMGWNIVRPEKPAKLFEVDPQEVERFYFVHSYRVELNDASHLAASCLYGEYFAASFEVGNLFGVQFHPEKSHRFGMELLKKYAAL